MKLTKVETKGFKSFADKISLSFDGSIVGIVGPNGSGKSNINDAIKWVLGEQSIKSLRGDSSDDVIFSGSKLVEAADRAEVSLTFDNSEGRLSIPEKTITISRVVERGSGENVYYINNELARLKDIKEIAMESGIGKSSLAIISQGTISDIAEADPIKRRGIFEEAAGISKYKARKLEALRKLESTNDALSKVKTVVVELEKQLNPLRRQAEKAKIYLEKRASLKDVEIGLIVQDVNFFSEKLRELNSSLENVITTKEDLTGRIETIEVILEEKTAHKLKLENEVLKLSTDLQEISDKVKEVELKDSRARQRRQMIIDGEIKADSASRLEAMAEELKELSSKVAKYKVWEETSAKDVENKREAVASVQSKITNLRFEIDSNKHKLTQLRTKYAILVDQRDNKTNLSRGVKTIDENRNIFPGYKGVVSELIEVEAEHKVAIEAILASALQHAVVDNSETAVKAVHFLKENNAGRASFIPLSTIQPKGIIEEHAMVAQSQQGFVGLAADLVKSAPQYSVMVKFLLGNIIVTDTIEHANHLAKTLSQKYMVVSLEGDIVRAGGVITGGQKDRHANVLAVDEQIAQIETAIPQLESIIKKSVNELEELSNSIAEEQSIITELNVEIAKMREKRAIAEGQYAAMKSTYESNTNTKFNESEEDDVLGSSQSLEAERLSIQTLLKAKRESIMSMNSDLSQNTIQKTELEKILRDIVESSSEKLTEKSQAEFILNSQKRRLSEEYEMTVEAASQNFGLTMDIEAAREIVTGLRNEIKELGNVNVEAVEAFEEINARYTKLKSSEEELFSAQQTIVSAINEMDQIIISRLDNTIKAVNEEFNNVFKTMFGGGFAEIKYTDPSNLLETGVDVAASPPGKTVKNLKLFSGGEKALIAISLLFAILKSKPLPLCILDEVEAALDDANVVRFANYLQQLKQQTQFIVITHRVGTMARVDALFGATMQNRGVTSFFTVNLKDAEKLIEQ